MVNDPAEPNTQCFQSKETYSVITTEHLSKTDVELSTIASHIVRTCGIAKVLEIGLGEKRLVRELLKHGFDAYGLNASQTTMSERSSEVDERFMQGSIIALPLEDNAFHTIVSIECLEHLTPEYILQALAEMHRVARCYVFLQLATDNHAYLTTQGRAWWEQQCFASGFRKHPLYYALNDYEALNSDGSQIYILLEKISQNILIKYSLPELYAQQYLPIDRLRQTGCQSDASIERYYWACHYIKPGDRVLDVGCGVGYGSHVIRHVTQAAHVLGIDENPYAIEYAITNFTCPQNRAEYRGEKLFPVLNSYPDGSFEVIILFATLESTPSFLWADFYRLLTPGGRIIVSIANTSGEAAQERSPSHIHVCNWEKLKSELSVNFILEDAYAQSASQYKRAAENQPGKTQQRLLKPIAFSEASPQDCEWWLMTAMKTPLAEMAPYQERVFANVSSAKYPSTYYSAYYHHPWLMHAMVNSGYRLKNSAALMSLANEAINLSDHSSNDYAAAVCVKAYRLLGDAIIDTPEAEIVFSQIKQIVNLPCKDPMALRWKVSLLFVKGKLLYALGHLDQAKAALLECATYDVREFGIHLATKPTEALYLAGKIAYIQEKHEEARIHWSNGIQYSKILLSVSIEDILINIDFPNRFNHGDGIREYTVAWDNIARCANGIYWLNRGGGLDFPSLDNCHQTEYSNVTKDVILCRQTLIERTLLLEQVSRDLVERTEELVSIRQTLVERTLLLEQANRDLQDKKNWVTKSILPIFHKIHRFFGKRNHD